LPFERLRIADRSAKRMHQNHQMRFFAVNLILPPDRILNKPKKFNASGVTKTIDRLAWLKRISFTFFSVEI
jgi:hypothetical protein